MPQPATPATQSTRRHPWGAILAALLLALGIGGWLLLHWGQGPSAAEIEALSQGEKAQRLAATAQGLDYTHIQASLIPATHSLEVTQQLQLTNRGQEARDTLVLRTYPNAFQLEATSPIAGEELYARCYPKGFSSGALVVSHALLTLGTDSQTQYRYTDSAKTVLLFSLPGPWQPGSSLQVTLSYTLTLPQAAFHYGEHNGLWALGNAFVWPALWQEGAYRTDPYYPVGSPLSGPCMNADLSLDLPLGYTCALGAIPQVEALPEGGRRYRCQLPDVRDVALCFSQGYKLQQAIHRKTLVSVHRSTTQSHTQALAYAKQALACYEERFGPYPYPALTLAEVDMPQEGAAYPGLVMLSSRLLAEGGQPLELAVALQVARQWWGMTLGSDGITDAWQGEALSEYSLLLYVEDTYGIALRQDLERARIETALQATLPRGSTPGSPLDAFPDGAEYTLVVSQRGAALFSALDLALDGRLDDFLKAYYDKYSFAFATRKDFEALLATHTGEDFGPLLLDYLDTYR